MTDAPHYRPASYGNGARRWRVIWYPDPADAWHYGEIVDDRGHIVRFASYESAKARADRLNLSGAAPEKHPDYGWRMPNHKEL